MTQKKRHQGKIRKRIRGKPRLAFLKKLNEEKGSRASQKRASREIVRCPTCLKHAEPEKTIYTCQNGHVTWETRNGRTKQCAVCKQGSGEEKTFALQSIVAEATERPTFPCRWKLRGCTVRSSSPFIRRHENLCTRRIVGCPGRLMKTCGWAGPIHKLMQHATVRPCLSPVWKEEGREHYQIDVPQPVWPDGISIYRREEMAQFRPRVLMHPGLCSLFVYFSCYRTPTGWWYIFCRAIAGTSELERARVEITVKRGISREREEEKAADVNGAHVYRKEYLHIVPSEMSNEHIPAQGNVAISLHDQEIIHLSNQGILFRCEIDLHYVPPEEKEGAELCAAFEKSLEKA